MSHRTLFGIANGFGITPDGSRLEVSVSTLPCRLAFRQFSIGEVYRYLTLFGIDGNDIAILQQSNRTANRRLWPDMANAESPRRPRESTIGNQGYLVTTTLTIDRGSGRQHLAHSGPAARPFVANDQHLAILIVLGLNGCEGLLLRIKNPRGALKTQL